MVSEKLLKREVVQEEYEVRRGRGDVEEKKTVDNVKKEYV
jgi:hypothetical protein